MIEIADRAVPCCECGRWILKVGFDQAADTDPEEIVCDDCLWGDLKRLPDAERGRLLIDSGLISAAEIAERP